MRAALLSVIAALVSVLAFPPYALGFSVLIGVALFLAAVRMVERPRHGFWIGFLYGMAFWGGLMWWLIELHWSALFLAPVQALFTGMFAWWMARHDHLSGVEWSALAVGSWAVMELLRYRVPVGGQEWGAAGYALSGYPAVRALAPSVGSTGVTMMVVAAGALAVARSRSEPLGRGLFLLMVPLLLVVPGMLFWSVDTGAPTIPVAIVQGSTPCPFESCPPNQRLRTFGQHLTLTRAIEAGSVELVVWPESSTGSTNADPVNNPAIREQIAAEARRIGAWFLVGGDRVVSETEWINANVVFDPDGEVVGEYRKQHPVPFGEYVPWRSFFTRLIPELYRVPRDMIRGEGPVVFEIDGDGFVLGSVISWEGGFSRYARQHAALGATILVVATNNDSYGPEAPTSLQFIGMTRMRAAELGVPLVHAAVTGRSVLIDPKGELVTEVSGQGTGEIVYGSLSVGPGSLHMRTGDVLMVGYALVAVVVWWRARRTLLVSTVPSDEEE